jgi:glucokinase
VAAAPVIGVDLGGTKIATGIVEGNGSVRNRHERRTPLDSQESLLAALDAAIEEVREDEAAAIGLGVPSTIDQRSGRAVRSVNIPLADIDLRTRLAHRFGLPVGIDNDANAATLAEWRFGAGRGTQHMVMLTLGTGVGGGLILDGRPYRGSVGAGAELGHMVIDLDGPRCQGACEGHGHLEVIASGQAAGGVARSLWGDGATARELVTRAKAGEPPALEALAELGGRLGAGIASLVNVFNPELVVVGGGFAVGAGELLLHPAREFVAREALVPARDLVRIVPAELGPEAGVVGAGLVGLEALGAGSD